MCLDCVGATQATHQGGFTHWSAASHERNGKPSPSRSLICHNMSCWEQYLYYILSVTPCEHLVRRTRAPKHHAEHRAWRKATALPWQQAFTGESVNGKGNIDIKSNRRFRHRQRAQKIRIGVVFQFYHCPHCRIVIEMAVFAIP